MSRARTSRKVAPSSRPLLEIEDDLSDAVAFVRLLDVMMLFGCDHGLESDDVSAAARLLEHLAPIVRRLNQDFLEGQAPRQAAAAGDSA